jgi:hypothetical protein
MYPYDFTPALGGLNPEEVFVVMPFESKYDQVFTDLIESAVASSAKNMNRVIKAYRTKGDLRTTSGWIEVMEHLYTAQVVLGVLTKRVNSNVQYELGIAHATQPIRRQVLIAEGNFKPAFDTKDLIFMKYSPSALNNSIGELAERIQTALQEWDVEQEAIVRHAIAKITPFEFEIVMQWASFKNFAVGTSGSGPVDYEKNVAQVHGSDERYMQGVFLRHCDAIGRLQRSGLLGLNTHADPPNIEFSYYWTDLGNLVLLKFRLIDQAERLRRFKSMPMHLRRVS